MQWSALFAVIAIIIAIVPSWSEASSAAIRSFVEQEIKPEFEKGITDFMEAARTRASVTDKHKLEIAIDGIKDMFYSKAYGLYRCVKEADAATKEAVAANKEAVAANASDYIVKCYEAFNKRILKTYKIISALMENPQLLHGGWENKCELKSRMFDAEIEFPPFDFLRTTTGTNGLYDDDAFDACLLSDDHH